MRESPDFHLITLGGLGLDAPRGTDTGTLRTQRRKLAVLTVLALSRKPVPRDRLVEMFWGDQDEHRARHSLSEAFSHLRRVLGRQAITTRQSEVALTGSASLTVDAVEFSDAVAAGALDRALALYTGPFLDGAYLGGSARFEEWADRERRRLEGLFLSASATRCRELADAGRWEECEACARRWLATEPLSAEAAARMLIALDAQDTHDALLRAAREYERLTALLAREYELEPAPEVTDLARRIGRRLAPSSFAAAESAPEQRTDARVVDESPRLEPEPPASVPTPAGPHHRTQHRSRLIPAVALAGMSLALVLLFGWRTASAPAREATARLAVLPFAVRGDSNVAYLGEGLVDLLSVGLDGAGIFRSIDPGRVLTAARADSTARGAASAADAAERLGARYYVTGTVVAADEQLRIMATLHERGTRDTLPPVIAQVAVDGSHDELFGLVDSLTALLLARAPDHPGGMLGRTASTTTSSLPALKAYLRGEAHFRSARYVEAFEAFQQAAGQDSTFALAHHRLALTATWAGGLWPSAAVAQRSGTAVRHAARLPRRPRMLVEGYHAWITGDFERAERLYREIVRQYPDESHGWYLLGEVFFHSNPARGRSIVESRQPFERVLAIEPNSQLALTHLARVAAREGQTVEAERLLTRLMDLVPEAEWPHLMALRASLRGTRSDRAAALERLRASANDEWVRVSAHRVAMFAHDLESADRMLQLITGPGRLPEVRAHAHLWLADLALARGRWSDAQPHFAAARALDRGFALLHEGHVAALAVLGVPPEDLRRLRDDLLGLDPNSNRRTEYPYLAVLNGLHPQVRLYLLAVLSARAGEPAAALRFRDSLQALGGDAQARELARGMAESVVGHVAAAGHDPRAAIAALERGRLVVPEGLLESEFGSQSLERWMRAEALVALGRHEEALSWYASLAEGLIDRVIYLAPAHLRQAQIHERLGRPGLAAQHYARFVTLWQDCDPSLRPLVDEARAKIGQLRRHQLEGRLSRSF